METSSIITECPVCRGRSFEKIYELSLPRPIDFMLCLDCALVFQHNPLGETELKQYYENSCVFHEHGAGSRAETLATGRYAFLRSFLPQSTASDPKNIVVDVGCGYGDFLQQFDEKSWIRRGLELNETRARHAEKVFHIDVIRAMLENAAIDPANVDLVSGFGLIEHLQNPGSFLVHLDRILKAGGLGCINAPDLLNPMTGMADFFSPEHLLYFTRETLGQLIQAHGFSVVAAERITPDYPDIAFIFRKVEKGTADVTTITRDTDVVPAERERIRGAVQLHRIARDKLMTELYRKINESGILSDPAKLAIYGAGEHTRQLLAAVPELQQVAYYLDGDPQKKGMSFVNGRIYSVDALRELDIRAILISSKAFEQEILQRLLPLVGENIKVVTLYS